MTDDGTITLYHGTIHDFTAVDVRKGKPFKDFGQGFYASQSRESAVNMALRNRDIELRRLARRGITREVTPWLHTFVLESARLGALKVKRFHEVDKEWVRFVVSNRTNETPQHDYDIVVGATANDVTSRTAQLYLAGEYGDVGSDEAVSFFLRRIQPERLPRQFFFGTQRAADLLVRKGRHEAL
ncbi:MAG: DUF3990 domain-containing protein [Clostridiales Family XIII bacterium]|nr:DUF3990 domain-containing protein [Clostridiales Family XIII bacterium]